MVSGGARDRAPRRPIILSPAIEASAEEKDGVRISVGER